MARAFCIVARRIVAMFSETGIIADNVDTSVPMHRDAAAEPARMLKIMMHIAASVARLVRTGLNARTDFVVTRRYV